jgi:DNA-binding NtrC family response regulator
MSNGRVNLRCAREALDAQAIRAAIKRCGGNRLAAARELGIHKTTLFRKIRQLNIDLPEPDGRI